MVRGNNFMRLRRLLPVLAAVSVASLLAPSPASAGNRNEPLIADVNRDGLVDRITLGPETGTPAWTPNCAISVEYRNPNGSYQAPQTHTYASPWSRQPFCPNMGEAINLGPLGQIELVLTNFSVSSSPTLLVLNDFEPVAMFDGLTFPSTIRSEDFNGDGREDLWQSSDQDEQLKTFTNTGWGTLVPGPIDVCTRDSIPQHVLTDFNRDGGMDFLVVLNCQFSSSSAQVLFGNGQQPVTLASRQQSFGFAYQVFEVDVDNDRIPDAGVIDRHRDGTSTIRFFRNDGRGGFTETTTAPGAAAPSAAALAATTAREQAAASHPGRKR